MSCLLITDGFERLKLDGGEVVGVFKFWLLGVLDTEFI